MKKHVLLIALLGLGSVTMWANPIDRTKLEGLKGDEILQKLHTMIKDHEVLDYDDVRADKARVDVVSNKVVDMYSSCQFSPYDDYCRNRTDYVDCDCFNREHALPKAWWGGDKTVPMYTDLHHVIPTDFAANTKRQDYPYGEVSSQSWTNGVSKFGTTNSFPTAQNARAFEPADEYKGDIARIYFYMLTCYLDYQLNQNTNSKMVFGYSASKKQSKFTSDALNLFLKWYRNDAVSSKETTRNDKVEAKQGNRNPFVDYPELVEYIWGNKKTVPYSIETDLFEQKIEQAAQRKVIIDGRLYIKADDALYDIMGNKVANF